MTTLDIAVAGCGPAGMTAALLLHRQGHRVTIYERFETPGPVGSGLLIQPTGQAVLARLGLDAPLRERGAKVTGLLGRAAPSGRTALDVRYVWLKREDAHGIGIHRAALFAILHDAARAAGIPVEAGRAITGSALSSGRRSLSFALGPASPPYELIVDAMGTRSPLAPEPPPPLAYGALWATLDWAEGFAPHLLEQRYRRASQMVGVLPIGRVAAGGGDKACFFWSLRGDQLDRWREDGLARWQEEVLALWPETEPLLAQITDPAQLTFARYTHRTLAKPAEPALVHIGDAWHSTSPQLGQGANMAVLDAWAVAHALATESDLARALAKAVKMRRGHVRLYQALSLLFTPAYQSDGRFLPWVRDHIVPPFARLWPATRIQAEMVAGTFGNPLPRLGL